MDLTTLERLPLWIGGRAVAATTTRYGEVTNPATGEVIRHVPLANAADVDAAVAAATAALPAMARRAGAAPRAHADALSRPDGNAQEGSGATRIAGARQDAARRGGLDHARHRSGRVRHRHSASAEGRIQRQRRHRRRQLLAAPAGRRLRGHHAVQFPGDGADVDVSDGARLRQHVHPQAFGARPDDEPAHGGAAQGSGLARRRVQRRAWRQGSGRRDPRRIRTSRRCRSSARRRSRSTSTRRVPRTASACRRSAARRITRSCCPMPISSSRPTR